MLMWKMSLDAKFPLKEYNSNYLIFQDIMVAGGMESMSNVPMFENRTSPVYGNRVVKVSQ